MVKPTWTTPEQRAVLAPFIPAFRDAQESKTTTQFMRDVHETWFAMFPATNEKTISKEKTVSDCFLISLLVCGVTYLPLHRESMSG